MDKPTVFTPEDLIVIRKGLDSIRTPGAYEPGRWSVSKYNRDRAVVGDLPESARLRDITLRTVHQMSGVAIDSEGRRRLIEAIAQSSVPSMELGAFRRGQTPDDMAAQAAIARKINPSCELVLGGLSSKDDLAVARDAGYDAAVVWSTYLGTAAPSSSGAVYHLAWTDRDWRQLRFPREPQDQVDRTLALIQHGNELGMHVFGSINMLALTDDAYVDMYCRQVADAGCAEITLADGSSGVGPEAFRYLVAVARAAAPKASIGVHVHNQFGLAMSCAIEALKAGADLIEVAVNGYEDHAGQPDLAGMAVTLEALYGIRTGIALQRMWDLARLGEEITKVPLQWNHPVTGLSTFQHGGGDEYSQKALVDPLIDCAITAGLVGGEARQGVGVTTGPFTMWDKLVALGIEPESKEEVDAIRAKVRKVLNEPGALMDETVLQELAVDELTRRRGRPVTSRERA
jgi:isopropylmalate/homocitrate/citramalate synthase